MKPDRLQQPSLDDKQPRSIVYYVSGHGFGHATRSCEVIRMIRQLRPEVPVFVRSWANPLVFREMIGDSHVTFCRFDIGVVQTDGITMDIPETLQQAKSVFDSADQAVDQELCFLKEVKAGCIVSDVPAIAHRIARQADIPSLAVTNFSWDWIYDGWREIYPAAASLVERLREDYKACDLLMRLPYSEKLPAFSVEEEVPMLGRKAALEADVVRHRLGLSDERRPLVLLSFGGMGLSTGDFPKLGNVRDFRFLTTFPVNHPIVTPLKPLAINGIGYPDLVNAVDIVATKPGYGIVSECAVNHTRMLYTERGAFREFDAIMKELSYWNCSQFISREKLLEGQWRMELEQLMNKDPTQVPGAQKAALAQGSCVVSTRILDFFSLGRIAN